MVQVATSGAAQIGNNYGTINTPPTGVTPYQNAFSERRHEVTGSLAGVPFDLDPESIAYHFDIKASATNTVGGRVVQVFGTKISDLFVTGSFGLGGWEAQQAFLDQMVSLMQGQEGSLGPSGFWKSADPVVFSYPPRNWNFDVFVLSNTQPGGQVFHRPRQRDHQPPVDLDLFIVNDNGGLVTEKDAALSSYLNRLANGIGWTPNVYNNVANNDPGFNVNTPTPPAATKPAPKPLSLLSPTNLAPSITGG